MVCSIFTVEVASVGLGCCAEKHCHISVCRAMLKAAELAPERPFGSLRKALIPGRYSEG
jgi:hypothetical protein